MGGGSWSGSEVRKGGQTGSEMKEGVGVRVK